MSVDVVQQEKKSVGCDEIICYLGVCMAIFFFKWHSQQMVQVGLWTLQNPYWKLAFCDAFAHVPSKS